jgi:predicted RNase H-like HicB family nuclease/DNA-binding XRE family transcriptional regulator
MRYHFKVHKEGKGFWAECLELPGCLTEGDSKEELFENMQDALNTYLEEPKDSKFLADLPDESIKETRSIIEVPVDPSIALAFSIRRQRIEKGLTQKEAAQKLGMKGLYSYQRLEKRCNPTLDVIFKLANLFPALSLDAVLH